MLSARAALGADQVVSMVDLEDMRRLDPDRLFGDVDAGIEDHGARPDHRARAHVVFLQPDRAMPLVAWRLGRRTIVDDVGATVVVEEQ